MSKGKDCELCAHYSRCALTAHVGMALQSGFDCGMFDKVDMGLVKESLARNCQFYLLRPALGTSSQTEKDDN